MNPKFAAILPAVFCVSACARTSMSSLASPDLRGRVYRNILVVANFSDLALRRDAEDRLAASSAEDHFRFVPSYGVFFPAQQYDSAQVVMLLRQNHIDATLVISPGGTGASTGYVPPTYTTGCTMWSSSSGCTRATTTTTGGYTYSRPWAQFTARLFDAVSGDAVWVATATTGGNAYASGTTLVRSMADKTAAQLLDDGIIRN